MKKIINKTIGSPSKNILELIPKSLEPFHDKNLREEKILTGYGALDRTIGGLKQGELVIIGGRPAMGKTQLAINFAKNISETLPVLFFTLEMSEYQITKRFISSAAGVSIINDFQQDFTNEEMHNISQVEDVSCPEIGLHN
jgi:replicative DNA helicase